MNKVEKNNPRHGRPSRWNLQARREQLENKEQEILREVRTKRNRPNCPCGRMEQRGWGHPQHEDMQSHQRPHRHFGWRTEETYWSDEITPDRGGFHQRTNRPLRRGMHWAVRPRRSEGQPPERTPRHRHWSWRPRHADEFRREGGEFRDHRIRDGLHQAQPSQGRHRHWSMRPRHADEFRREGGEFRGRRIRERNHQAQPGQRHPSHILREKWMLEEKLFRITRRIQRLNRQLRG